MEFDKLSNRIIGCALEVHRHLGPGLLESTYEKRRQDPSNTSGTITHVYEAIRYFYRTIVEFQR